MSGIYSGGPKMRRITSQLIAIAILVASAAPHPARAQNIDFGDDGGRFSRDGECDDMRFSGPGMTDTPLLDSDIGHDATDCRAAYNQGRLTYNGGRRGSIDTGHIIWGDDASKYARDGECDARAG